MSFINSIGKPFTELQSTDSTNNYAMAQVQKGVATHGETWFAYHQTKGKGQYGKNWEARSGENILMSVLLKPATATISGHFLLNMAIALAVYDFVCTYLPFNIKIKWPNDIYYDDRKAAGILIENIIRGNVWQWAVTGIGININQTIFDNALKNPVSLKQISGEHYDVVALAKELCIFLQTRFNQFVLHEKNSLLHDYNEVLYKRNETVQLKIKSGGTIDNCIIKGVNASGELIVEGKYKHAYSFGEVEWMID